MIRVTCIAAAVSILFLGNGCSTVPGEVVELSYMMGEDISAVHQSYLQLINIHFEDLKTQRENYLEDEWMPVFLGKWTEDGHLQQIASGEEIWSEEDEKFIPAPAGSSNQAQAKSLYQWSQSAIDQIETKRSELLDTLEVQQRELIALIDEAFANLYRANATITAHLNSLKKVQDVQDKFLEDVNLKKVRDDINNTLIKVSDGAEKQLEQIRKADDLLREKK